MIHLRREIAHLPVLAVEGDVGGEGLTGVLAEDVFETVTRDFSGGAEVPFAELGGGVASALETGGEGDLAVKAVERAAVGFDAEAGLEFSDHQAGA